LGRVYLPQEDLQSFAVSPEDLSKQETTLGVRELLRLEAERAWALYKEGSELLDYVHADSRGALWLLVRTYSALLARIEALDFAALKNRVRFSKSEKLSFIARARFGRLTKENIIEKRDSDRRRASGTLSRRRAG
jgi:15-cis-phytoene synthase